jgi:tetratricopeptide (TPR) repeat protein
MPIKTERDISPAHREILARSRSAGDAKNYDYAITLLIGVVKAEPAFLEGRQRLRSYEIAKFKAQSGLSRQTASMKASASGLKLGGAVKKNPTEALSLAEDILLMDPYNSASNNALADAAKALDLMPIAALAYETVVQGDPKNKDSLHKLANLYMSMGDPVKAEAVFTRIIEMDPRDGEALSGMKNASAANASRSGGWETARDYRDTLKNKEEASKLEQAGKVMKSDEAIDEQIAGIYQKSQEEPQNPLHAKRIAELCVQKEDYETAVQWFRHAFELGGRTDGSLEKMITDLEIKVVDKNISTLREAAESGEPEAVAQLAHFEQLRGQQVLDIARKRVEKYPNDNQFRFELGEALYHTGQYRDAMKELQQGAKQPNVRLRALSYLGLCQKALGMTDLAIKTFSNAAAELPTMDGTKKDLVYNLALTLEALNRNDEYIEQLKLIYEVDMAYRDVAQRVEKFYGL